MSKLIPTVVSVLMLVLVGCSSALQRPDEAIALKLLLPENGPQPMLLKQKVELEAWGQKRQFVALSRLTRDISKMVALLPTGQQLLYLEYDGSSMTQKALPSIELPGKDIMAIIQFALWPEISVTDSYKKVEGWQVHYHESRRQLSFRDRALLDVTYTEQAVVVENYLDDYRVTIQTIEQKDLEL